MKAKRARHGGGRRSVALGKIVSSLVADVITPAIGKAMGGVNFADLQVPGTDPAGALILHYTACSCRTFSIIIIAAAIFMAIKINRSLRRALPAPVVVVEPPADAALLPKFATC